MSANIPPTCPDTHIFNQMACLCEPKKKALKGKKHKKKLDEFIYINLISTK